VSLTVWTGFTGGDRPGYEQIVKDFNAAHPDIKVTMTVQPWDTIQQKLPSAWLTGQGPDIAAPSSDPIAIAIAIAQYVKTNSVLALTATGTGDDKINSDQFASPVGAVRPHHPLVCGEPTRLVGVGGDENLAVVVVGHRRHAAEHVHEIAVTEDVLRGGRDDQRHRTGPLPPQRPRSRTAHISQLGGNRPHLLLGRRADPVAVPQRHRARRRRDPDPVRHILQRDPPLGALGGAHDCVRFID
jgi:hypothetical protein